MHVICLANNDNNNSTWVIALILIDPIFMIPTYLVMDKFGPWETK